MTAADYPDWGVPQAHATDISLTGAPLLRLTVNLGRAAAATLNGGFSAQLLNLAAVGQPSYEATIVANLPAGAGTVPFAVLTLTWVDAISTLASDTETFLVPMGNGPSNAVTCYMSGPARGSQLSVTLTNLDPAQVLTYSWTINQTSHVYSRDRLLQPLYPGVAPVTFTNPAGTPANGLLMGSKPVIAANSSASRLVAAWNGRAVLSVDNGAQANAVNVILADPGSLYSTIAGLEMAFVNVAAGLRQVTEVQMPNGPVLLTMTNTGTTGSITPQVALVKREF